MSTRRAHEHSWFQGKRVPLYFVVGASVISEQPARAGCVQREGALLNSPAEHSRKSFARAAGACSLLPRQR